ncbi:MAG: ATP-binding protein [Sideroxydans sp.]|jgi:signal transduction histidine kinase/DNA-binding NarL/FixJ family response regulator
MLNKELRVLLVESSDQDAGNVLTKLTDAGYVLKHTRVSNEEGMQRALSRNTFDVILCSDEGNCFGGLPALSLLRRLGLDIPFLLLARELKEETILRTLQAGVDDYILKGSLNRLSPSIEHNLHQARIRKEYRVVQSALQESQARMHAFIADLPGMAYQIRLNADGRITFPYVSEGCHPLLGIEAQELTAAPNLLEEMLHPEDADNYRHSMLRSAGQLTFWNWEGRLHTHPSGEIKWINLRCSPRRIEDDVLWEGIMLNITQSKMDAAELIHSQQLLQDLSAHIEDVREQERVAIAREVHDELGSLLTATKLDIAWLCSHLKDDTRLASKAKDIEVLIDKCTRAASNISRSLRPSALDTFGIVAAIDNEVQEFAQRTGISCDFEHSDETLELGPRIAISLFRILQEALTNITKHAEATQVGVSLLHNGSVVELTINDNGRGIRDADRAKPHSFGLRGIFERVAHFGGEVKLHSAPDRGTTLSVQIPCHHDETVQPDLQCTIFD